MFLVSHIYITYLASNWPQFKVTWSLLQVDLKEKEHQTPNY